MELKHIFLQIKEKFPFRQKFYHAYDEMLRYQVVTVTIFSVFLLNETLMKVDILYVLKKTSNETKKKSVCAPLTIDFPGILPTYTK